MKISTLPQMEPLIKESTSRLAEKISVVAENGETVEALQWVMQMSVCRACYTVIYITCVCTYICTYVWIEKEIGVNT